MNLSIIQRHCVLRPGHTWDELEFDLSPIEIPDGLSFEVIDRVVCHVCGISEGMLQIKRRFGIYCIPRHIFNGLVRKYLPMKSLNQVGLYLDGRNHVTILHGRRTCDNLRETNAEFRELYDKCEMLLIKNNQNETY